MREKDDHRIGHTEPHGLSLPKGGNMDRISVGRHLANPCTQPDLGDLYPAYLSGSLDERMVREVTEHVSRCLACQAELDMWLLVIERGFERSYSSSTSKLK